MDVRFKIFETINDHFQDNVIWFDIYCDIRSYGK
jgi:hypothetical protein